MRSLLDLIRLIRKANEAQATKFDDDADEMVMVLGVAEWKTLYMLSNAFVLLVEH